VGWFETTKSSQVLQGPKRAQISFKPFFCVIRLFFCSNFYNASTTAAEWTNPTPLFSPRVETVSDLHRSLLAIKPAEEEKTLD